MAGQDPLRINSHLELPAGELEFSTARSGGPGGQNVNKVASKVVLRFSIARSRVLGERRKSMLFSRLGARLTGSGEIVIHASTYREQARNLEDARERLAQMLREALKIPKARRKTKPTRGSVKRRINAKRQRGDQKKLRGRDPRED